MDILKKFLDSEINDQELYDDIISFITSYNIRNGEYEGNRFIIKKMDRLNFIIFPEDEYEDGRREISYSMSLYKHSLLKEINKQALEKNLITRGE